MCDLYAPGMHCSGQLLEIDELAFLQAQVGECASANGSLTSNSLERRQKIWREENI